MSYLSTITNPLSVITPIENGVPFPENLYLLYERYKEDIALFRTLALEASSSAELLSRIRDDRSLRQRRMSLLKIFRRCVALVLDTETSKKIRKYPTSELVRNYGQSFKPIKVLRDNFLNLSTEEEMALAALVGEYDERGQLGYMLTTMFFAWFEEAFPELVIEGPRGAGRDIELSSIFSDFPKDYPCDFVIRGSEAKVLAVGFARYDSTRGGAQSDDRTAGNEVKVLKAAEYSARTGRDFKIIFLADGPGLAHGDTWRAACQLDDSWDGRVRVTTFAMREDRISLTWFLEQR